MTTKLTLIIYLATVAILYIKSDWFDQSHDQSDRLLKFGRSILLTSLGLVSVHGFGLTAAYLSKQIGVIVSQPSASYEDKLVRAYGGFYPAMRFVTELTPDDALILIPPQANPWEVEGNAPMVTYYLYPRKVQNMTDQMPATDRPVYALIAHGSWPKTGETDYGWPKINISSSRIWRFESSSHALEEFSREYNPVTDKWDWGLIEVKP